MKKTDFVVIRHGQTAANLQGILQGQQNVPLDEMGRLQAQHIALRLQKEKFDLLISSDLIRASETAETIGKTLGISPILTSELREWNLGELEGKKCTVLWEEYPEIMDTFKYHREREIQVPGGESRFQFFARIIGFLEKTGRDHEGKRILLVTHGGVMRAIFQHIVAPPKAECMFPKTDNASYSRFLKCGDFWQLLCWNDVSHLAGAQPTESLTF